MNETYALIKKISPDPGITDLFFLRHDYHNLKVLLKSEETGMGANEKNLMKSGTIELAVLLHAVQEKKFNSLTEQMKRALTDLDKAFSISRDVSLIDIFLDKAYAQEAAERLRDKKGFAQKYFSTFVDFENILILFRAREAGLSKDLFLRALLPGGILGTTALEKAYELPREELKGMLARGVHAAGIGAALDEYYSSGNLQTLEKYRDDALLKTAGGEKNDLFSIAPVVYYLIKKEREAKAVKMAMTAKLFDLNLDDVQKILVEV
jgi:V/A-type H+-transporting ATPase subunit C